MSPARDRQHYVYILANYTNAVLYTGMTNDLLRRVQQHRDKVADSFTARYNVFKLVYYEVADGLEGAYVREKAIKGGSRKRKEELITSANPLWRDLFSDLLKSQ